METPATLHEAFAKAVTHQNLDNLMACYHSDAIHFSDDGSKIEGRDAIRSVQESFIAMEVELSYDEIKIHELEQERVLIADRWKLLSKQDDFPPMEGRGLHIAKKEEGRWKYLATGLQNVC